MRKRTRILLTVLAVVLILAGAGTVWVRDTYPADTVALTVLSAEHDGIAIVREADWIIFQPDAVLAGLIFYPGAKVEAEAYAPLMLELAENGFLCVLLKMPLNLAILKSGAAEGVIADFPDVENWILAGHSMGGAAAGMYAGKHADQLDGLALLATYSTADLSGSGLAVLSIYGSEDGVLNRSNYEKYRANLPSDTLEIIIPGGNHAGFGDYGPQKGDGEAQISADEQIHITADAISGLFLNQTAGDRN